MTDRGTWALCFVAGVGAGALLAPGLPALLRRLGFERTNFQGDAIATAGGLLFLLAWLPGWWWPEARAWAAAVTAYALLGAVDDRWGTAEFKGLRGHLRALRGGRVTTGLVKAVGGLGAALLLVGTLDPRPGPVLLRGAALALTANFFNLLDLRPLRALKAFWLLALPLSLAVPPLLAYQAGLTLPYARLEARRRVMLGDTGANALGGLAGFVLAAAWPLWGTAAWLAALVLFHAWAERNSLSAWIEWTPWARALDDWGWRKQEPDQRAR